MGVVFGHCISDCSSTGSNVDANQAVQIQQDIKEFNNGEFACNGGAFFWVATHDAEGAWSDAVVREVSQTAGCSNSQTSSPTTITASVSSAPSIAPTSTPSNEPTTGGEPTGLTSAPSNVPTNSPTPETSTVKPTSFPTTSQPTQAPILLTSAPTKAPQTQTTLQPTQELVINTENRCGPSELHARETCGTVCQSQADCAA